MKKTFLMLLLTAGLSYGQTFARDTEVAAASPLLSNYYEVKNALVATDQKTAAEKAKELSAAIAALDFKTLKAEEQQPAKVLQAKLADDAKAIAAAKDIAAQRTAFATLSVNFYELSKLVKLSDQPVYYAYCPMKKSYWLSNESAIKNPYYGNQMLTCGTVKETIK